MYLHHRVAFLNLVKAKLKSMNQGKIEIKGSLQSQVNYSVSET